MIDLIAIANPVVGHRCGIVRMSTGETISTSAVVSITLQSDTAVIGKIVRRVAVIETQSGSVYRLWVRA